MKQRYLENVCTLQLHEDKCIGCGMCGQVCPHDVFELSGKRARIRDLNACMECGACARNCPFGAVTVTAGVGCATGIIMGALTGTEPNCCGGGTCC